MEKKTLLVQVEIPEGRAVICHFMSIIFDNGAEISRSAKPHTVTFLPDTDHDQMLAAVNADITTREGMKWDAIDPGEWKRACSHCKIEHTPEIKRAYKVFKTKALAEMKRLTELKPN